MKSEEIKWDWDKESEFLGEFLPADTLDRKKYASFLYDVCAARGEKSNLVVNINAEWGAGKTYFTKRLAQTISLAHPTVYIDAWKEDFSEDPLLTVFSSIKEQLTGQSDKFTTLINKTIENIGPLLKTATPLLLEGLVKKFTGVENFTDLTKDLSAKLLELHSEKSNKITTIKNGISTWVRYIKQEDGIQNKQLPLFIIIDELDRCRPDFAINLLEIIKHIFNIPGVVFIISTDTEQLQHSIKVIYGHDFSANQYLSRFFDRRFLLPSPKMENLIRTHTINEISNNYENIRDILVPFHHEYDDFISNCTSVFEAFNMNLRDALKIYNRLMDQFLISTKRFDATLYLILSCIYTLDPELYHNIKNTKEFKDIINTKNRSNFSKEIRLNYNLATPVTGVEYFSNHNGLTINTLAITEVKIEIYAYILHTFNIINTPEAIGNAPHSHYPLSWKKGGLLAQSTNDIHLKVAWADTKDRELGITRHQYFELIELSTTLD